jgi:hypothetical protein
MKVTGRALNRYNAWAAIQPRRMSHLASNRHHHLPGNDGRLEHAQQMAGHESPRTTKLYDLTKDEITLSEVERIRL